MFVSYFPGWKRSDRLHLCSQIKSGAYRALFSGGLELSSYLLLNITSFLVHFFFDSCFYLAPFFLSHLVSLSSCTPAPFVFPSSISCVWQTRTYYTHTHMQLRLYAYGALCAHRWYFAPWWQRFQAYSLELLRTIQAVKSMGKKKNCQASVILQYLLCECITYSCVVLVVIQMSQCTRIYEQERWLFSCSSLASGVRSKVPRLALLNIQTPIVRLTVIVWCDHHDTNVTFEKVHVTHLQQEQDLT